MSFDWKSIVKSVAPILGTALAGPMGGAATKFLAEKFLGKSDASEQELADSILSASPDQLVRLKELDNAFQLEMKKLDVDVYNIDALDRDSARRRQAALKDYTPSILAYAILANFFWITWKLVSDGTVSESDQIILNTMGNLVLIALTYFLGNNSRIQPFSK